MMLTDSTLLEAQPSAAIGRDVWLRPGTADRRVWADTFTGLYHLPPDSMATPNTVLDLGANIGLVAAHYQHLWPNAAVVAVEMDTQNAELATLNAPGVLVREQAVAGVSGTVRWTGEGSCDGYRLDAFGSRLTHADTLEDIILRDFGPGGVDFVKMDVEGAEWDILALAFGWQPLVRSLLVELHSRGGDSDSLVAAALGLLKQAGYKAVRHVRHPQAVYAQ